jgi:hypothetical protein
MQQCFVQVLISLLALGLLCPTLIHGFSVKINQGPKIPMDTSSKNRFIQALDNPNAFNIAKKERTQLVAEMIQENPVPAPGSTSSFAPLAVGKWRIVYAPHISVMGQIFRGSFDPVYYIMKQNQEMTSHAKYTFPIIGSGWLSVSGTYGSQDEDRVCRVDFNRAWVKVITDEKNNGEPYDSLDDVPPSPWKNGIQALGRFFFVDAVSVFPVSYLDEDTIVFDFELLGTRICARKIGTVAE